MMPTKKEKKKEVVKINNVINTYFVLKYFI